MPGEPNAPANPENRTAVETAAPGVGDGPTDRAGRPPTNGRATVSESETSGAEGLQTEVDHPTRAFANHGGAPVRLATVARTPAKEASAKRRRSEVTGRSGRAPAESGATSPPRSVPCSSCWWWSPWRRRAPDRARSGEPPVRLRVWPAPSSRLSAARSRHTWKHC